MRQLDLSTAIMYIITGLIIDETLLVLFSLQMSEVSMVIYLGNRKGHLNAAAQRSAFDHRKCSHCFKKPLFLLDHEHLIKKWCGLPRISIYLIQKRMEGEKKPFETQV